MKRNPTRTDRDVDPRTGARAGALAHLNELDDYEVADGQPDIRGWELRTSDGQKLGNVKDLIVDTAAMRVRYMDVELDDDVARTRRGAAGNDDDRHVLVPIGDARLDDDNDDVIVGRRAVEMAGVPGYSRGMLGREYERGVIAAYGGRGAASTRDEDFYGDAHFDDRSFWGRRGTGREGAQHVTRSEEELRVGKRQVRAGEVDVRKHVETERVREQVPVMREEVTVERRPVSGDVRASGKPKISDDEIRVPVMAEEVVTEKRVVPKEEIVVRKEAVTDTRTVEGTVRKERVDVDRSGDVRTTDERGRR